MSPIGMIALVIGVIIILINIVIQFSNLIGITKYTFATNLLENYWTYFLKEALAVAR